MKRIQDVRCHNCPPFTMTTGKMVKLLHDRGVSIEDIFSMYYAIEVEADAITMLTVGDAQLAGFADLPIKPKERQPF